MKKSNSSALKHISFIIAIAMLLCSILFVPVAADETVIANLMPSADANKGNLTLTGCTMEENANGSVTFTLTAASASFNMVFTEGLYAEGSGTIYNDQPIDLVNPAFFVYDYASADGVTFGALIAHYTRKDKAAENKNADLYLNSMEGADYKEYQEQVGTGFGVWDWGKYVSSAPTKIFDDKIHRFTYVEGTLSGTVGSKLTIYSYYVSSVSDVADLGAVRPEKTVIEESTAESDTASTGSETVSADESVADESNTSVADESTDTNSAAESNTSTASESSKTEDSKADAEEDTGLEPIYYVLIIAGALIIIGGIVFVVMKKKK